MVVPKMQVSILYLLGYFAILVIVVALRLYRWVGLLVTSILVTDIAALDTVSGSSQVGVKSIPAPVLQVLCHK